MTDNDIIKALECCVQYTITDVRTYKGMPIEVFSQAVLALINRQKAEIERLEIKNEHLVCFLAEARKDVSKEFAKKLHKDIDNFREKREMVMLPYTEAALLYIEKCINELVKEMTEGSDAE